MKTTPSLRAFLLGTSLFSASLTHASTLYWDGTSAIWGTNTNWSTDSGATTPDPLAAPVGFDDVVFNISTVNGAETISLAAAHAARSLTFNNTGTTTLPGSGANRVLTIWGGGLTMDTNAGAVRFGSGSANQNVTIALSGGAQNFTNNSAANFTINNTAVASISRAAGATLHFNQLGAGVFAMSTTHMPNVNSIVGPWAFFGSGANMRYAFNNSGNIGAFTGTSVANAEAFTTAATNYEFSTSGTTTLTTNRTSNSMRYSGTGNTIDLGAAGANTLTTRGILATGASGTLTIQRTGGTGTLVIPSGTGTTNDLVIAGRQNVTITAPISQSTVTAASVIYSGTGTLSLSGDNTYTGSTIVNSGTASLTGGRTTAMGTVIVTGGGELIVNGNYSWGSGGNVAVGGASGSGTITQNGGNVTFASSNGQLLVGQTGVGGASGAGNTGNGTYNLKGGTLTTLTGTANRGIILGTNSGVSATFNLSGTGELNVVAGSMLQIGRSESIGSDGTNTVGIFNQTAGTATINGTLRMGGYGTTRNANTTAELNLSGGIFNAAGATIDALSGGNSSNSTINISGSADVTLPALTTIAPVTGPSTVVITFDGGTLKNATASANYLGVVTSAFIKDGGAKFNTAAGSITIAQALQEDPLSTGGGLTKEGNNTLTLAGTNTYTGATTISAGTLTISSTGSTDVDSAVSVTGTASLIVDGTVGGTLSTDAGTTLSGTGTIAGSATIQGFHNPGNSPGIQTFGEDLTYSGGTAVVTLDLNSYTNTNPANPNALFDQILVAGNLAFDAATTVNLVFSGLESTVDWSDSLWEVSQSWLLYEVTGTTTGVENLTLNQINWLDKDLNPFLAERAGNTFSLSESDEGIYLNYNVVPEPSTALLGGLGLLYLLRRRR